MAQDDYERSTGFVIFAGDETTSLGFHAKSFEEPTRNVSNLKLNWFTSAGIGQRLHSHATKPAEGFGLRLNISEIRCRLIRSESN